MDPEVKNLIKIKTSENTAQKSPSNKEISQIQDIVKMAYLDHQLFPTVCGNYLNKEDIRNKYLTMIIHFCLEYSLFDTLAYLYYEWFTTDQFYLWARSSNSKLVCRYRTSMFAESHFR